MTGLPLDPAEVEVLYRKKSETDFLLFAQGLTIPSARGPKLLGAVIAPFQLKCFQDLAPSLTAIRDGAMPSRRRFWVERTKKAGKDSDLAIAIVWLVAFATRPILVQVCAANQKQASIIKRRAKDLLFHNQWLSELVQIQYNKIVSTDRVAEVVIEATDSTGGAHGETPDVLILNELVHVARWGAMETHMNNADGVPQGVVIVSTNAGIKGSKAWTWRETALGSKRWSIHLWSEKSPWVLQEDVDEAKKRDPAGSEFKRLWRGKWISGSGDAVDDEAIDACFSLLGPTEKAEKGWTYLAGLDMGISHDHSGLVSLGVNRLERCIKVSYLRGFMPAIPNDRGTLEVDFTAVKEACVWMHQTYRLQWFGYDPAAGGWALAQELRKMGVPMKEMTFGAPSNLTAMAQAFVQVVNEGVLECYDDEEGRLRRDFGKFNITHRPPNKYKLEAVSDESGHADVGTALVICLPKAIQLLGGVLGLLPTDNLHFSEDEEGEDLTEDEVEDMPDELRAIYEMDEEDRLDRALYVVGKDSEAN